MVATGDGEWDTEDLETKAVSCIKCDSVLTINGGEVYVKATGSGGKGLKADWECYITGGKVRAITTGGLYYNDGTTENLSYRGNTDNLDDAYTSSPKGIKIGTKNEHGVLTISGGDVMVRTAGTNGEGIESKGTLDITGGSVMVAAYDDAINASSDLTISGGTVVAVGTNNDGIDTNGNLYIKGGRESRTLYHGWQSLCRWRTHRLQVRVYLARYRAGQRLCCSQQHHQHPRCQQGLCHIHHASLF